MKLFESLWQKRSRPRETGWHRSCSNLFRTTAQSHELEKGFPYNSVPFGMFTVIFTFPHWSKFTSWREKRLANIQLATLSLLRFFRMTKAKIEAARDNMPLEGPGTGLFNPNIYWDPVLTKSRIDKLHWIYIVWLRLTAAKLAEDKESHHSPGLYNLGTRPHYEIFQDRPLSPLLRSYQKVEPYRAGEGCVSQIICVVLHLSYLIPFFNFYFRHDNLWATVIRMS